MAPFLTLTLTVILDITKNKFPWSILCRSNIKPLRYHELKGCTLGLLTCSGISAIQAVLGEVQNRYTHFFQDFQPHGPPPIIHIHVYPILSEM